MSSHSVSRDAVDDRTEEERIALERVATGYHDLPEAVRVLAAEQLVGRYGYESEEFDVLDEEADS